MTRMNEKKEKNEKREEKGKERKRTRQESEGRWMVGRIFFFFEIKTPPCIDVLWLVGSLSLRAYCTLARWAF